MISIIVPVYNVEKYLPECIDSILDQTYNNLELILVDDGSLDSSGKICDEYALRDNRILVLHQKNSGVTRARAAGVVAAQGEWVCFVDGDDTIPKGSIETLMAAAENMTDIVVGRCDNRKIPKDMTIDEYRCDCIKGRKVHSGPYARAFRRHLFSSHIFDIPREVIRGEDQIMNVRLAFATEINPVFVDKIVYNYRQNEDSVMHRSVHTIQHAELFHRHLSLSIPDNKLYAKEILCNKIRSIINVIYDNPSDRLWKKTTFWYDLCAQMKSTNYRMKFSERILLLPLNKFTLKLAIRISRFLELLHF